MGDTFWQRLFRGVRRLRQRPPWADFAGPDWADRVMQVQVADRFHAKQGRTIARWTLHAGGRRLVVYLKRHYRLPWHAGLLALVRPDGRWSPALQEWDHLEWARAEGLPAPRAVAGGEYIGPWGRLQSFLAVEELTGMIALHEAIPAAAAALDPATFARWKRGLVAEMASVTLALHRRRAFHKDLYLCHFYIAEEDTRQTPDWRGRVRIIDLHRLARHPWTWRWWRVKDLAQLLYSSHVPGVTARDRLHFWRAYLRPVGGGRAARWEAWWIRARAQWRLRRDRRKSV
jgi:heptose I phosphotransferase